MTSFPSVKTQNIVAVSVEQASNGRHYVHVRKVPGNTSYGHHPELTPNEAEALARDINNASAEARRKDIARRV